MLLPNGPYETVLQEIVEALEADAGAAAVHRRGRRSTTSRVSLTDAFKANARTNEMSWRRLEASFNQAPRNGDPRIAFDDGRMTLN